MVEKQREGYDDERPEVEVQDYRFSSRDPRNYNNRELVAEIKRY